MGLENSYKPQDSCIQDTELTMDKYTVDSRKLKQTINPFCTLYYFLQFLILLGHFQQATGLGQSPKQESLVITEAKLLQDLRLRPQQWHQSMEGNVYNK